MKTKLFFMIVSLLISLSLLAETPNITLQRASGGTISITIGLATAGDIQVDWGDGNLVTKTVGTTNAGVKITGTVTGTNTVGLYGPITSLICVDASLTGIDVLNAPTLLKIDVPRNNLTAIDVSNCTDIYRVSVYQNNFDACGLDYFFLSLPTTTTGVIVTYNNSGANTCKTSIATDKGWTLGSGSPVGDGTGCLTSDLIDEKVTENTVVTYIDTELQLCNTGINGNANLYLYNVSGKLIQQCSINLSIQNKVNIGILDPGLYIVRIVSPERTVKSKLMINN